MQVKGVSLISTKEFVKEKFAQEGYEQWVSSLSDESAKTMNSNILASAWYPFINGMLEPTKKICELFYGGSHRGAEELGAYSADKSLHGIYRFFVKIASPDTLLKRATQLFGSYYNPGVVELVKEGEKTYIMKFSKFDPPSIYIEYRVLGWVKKALEICGAKSIRIIAKKHAENAEDFSELSVSWE